MLCQVHIFFSAHGVPVAYVEEAGDPYKAEMEECVQLIMAAVKGRGIRCPHTLAYQVSCTTSFRIGSSIGMGNQIDTLTIPIVFQSVQSKINLCPFGHSRICYCE